MKQEHARTINYIQGALNYEPGLKWFFAFGALLYFIRDMKLGKKFDQDYDVCLFNDDVNIESLMLSFEESGFRLESKMINDVTKVPLKLVYIHNTLGFSVDLYFLIKSNGMYWHCLDSRMENPKSGIPSVYLFKGVRTPAFDGDVRQYVWEDLAPKVNFPCNYGTLLDLWYPGWFIPNSRFGQSECEAKVLLNNCIKLKEKLNA